MVRIAARNDVNVVCAHVPAKGRGASFLSHLFLYDLWRVTVMVDAAGGGVTSVSWMDWPS